MSSKRGGSAWLTANFAAALMCGASTAALAAPAKDAGAAASEAKLKAMQQQLDEMRAQLSAMRSAGQTPDPRLSAIEQQLNAMAAQLAEMKTAQDTANTSIATLQMAPQGGTTTPSLPNGKPALASADGRFTVKEGECMGACGDAPVMMVNNKRMCGFMSNEKIDQLVEELK